MKKIHKNSKLGKNSRNIRRFLAGLHLRIGNNQISLVTTAGTQHYKQRKNQQKNSTIVHITTPKKENTIKPHIILP
jgi:hypothetical protein